jgi:hypothetical protein
MPILGLARTNDVVLPLFVHCVYALAVSIRKPLPIASRAIPVWGAFC